MCCCLRYDCPVAAKKKSAYSEDHSSLLLLERLMTLACASLIESWQDLIISSDLEHKAYSCLLEEGFKNQDLIHVTFPVV